MDIATLGLRVDTQDPDKAVKSLGRLSDSAKTVEKSAKRMGTGATGAVRQMIAANDNAARSVGALGIAYRRVAGIIGGLFATAIAAVSMRKFIDATIEADKMQAQLGAALTSTAGAAGQTIDSLNAHAAALQRVTTFGDEAINSMQGVLLTFTRIGGDVFPRATAAVLDMATRMGMDLKGAALQVGKALNDPILGVTALGRAGVQFSESQKEMIERLVETNRLAEAQAIILKELEVQFGGSAVAARDTLGGALSALGNAWGDLFELGKRGSEGLRLAVENLTKKLTDPAFAQFVDTIGTQMVGAFAKLIDQLPKLINILPAISQAFEELGKRIATTYREINAVISAGKAVIEFFDDLDASIRQAGRDIGIAPALDAELTAAKEMLANYVKFRKAAEASANDEAIENYKKTFGALERELIATINRLEPGPAFERMGRDSAKAFEQGFKPNLEVNLPRVIRGPGETQSTGEIGNLINSLRTDIRVMMTNDPVERRMIELNQSLKGASAQEVAAIRQLITEQERIRSAADAIDSSVNRSSDRISGAVGSSGDKIVGSITQQTNALSAGLARMEAQSAAANAANTSGAFGGSAGGSRSLTLRPNDGKQSQLDLLSAEARTIQAGLQYKQLSPDLTRDAEMRLAEIELESAKLNHAIIETGAAMNSLTRMINELSRSGASTAQIIGTVGVELKHLTGSNPFGGYAGGFADGGTIPRGQFGLVGERGPEFIKGPAEIIPMHAAPQQAVTHNNDNSRGDINISVNVTAQDGGRGSRESGREVGRQAASQVAYHLRAMGVA